MSVARIRDNVRGFARLEFGDAVQFVVSWCLLGLSRLLVVALPQSKIRHFLGEPIQLDATVGHRPDVGAAPASCSAHR